MKLYNTPHKQLEDVEPQHDNQLTVYTCGPTVYDYPHIGNWFTFVRYDILIRTIRLAGFEPKWIMNITDVGHLVSDADEGEDKLEKSARREGKTAWEVAEFYTDYFISSLAKLNILSPDTLPKATEHIAEQIELVKKLEDKGFTYLTDDGVYFDTAKFPTYADFAGLDLEGQESGARVAVNVQKHNPTDFALWKLSPAGQQRDMEWDSPWGTGFPGWHLECSAMSMKYLGETIDIHAGGIDHLPVHHTNEIAQSEAASGKPFVRYWMHANHITVDGQKIAKSAGNGITLEELAERGYSAMALRMLVLESHYRTQSMFSWDTLAAAEQRIQSVYAFADLQHQDNAEATTLTDNYLESVQDSIKNALLHDLNTPEVLRMVSEVVSTVSSQGLNTQDADLFKDFLIFLDTSLGFDLVSRPDITAEQKLLLQTRLQARQSQDWTKSDAIRDQLAEQGIGINDTPSGSLWFRLGST